MIEPKMFKITPEIANKINTEILNRKRIISTQEEFDKLYIVKEYESITVNAHLNFIHEIKVYGELIFKHGVNQIRPESFISCWGKSYLIVNGGRCIILGHNESEIFARGEHHIEVEGKCSVYGETDYGNIFIYAKDECNITGSTNCEIFAEDNCYVEAFDNCVANCSITIYNNKRFKAHSSSVKSYCI